MKREKGIDAIEYSCHPSICGLKQCFQVSLGYEDSSPKESKTLYNRPGIRLSGQNALAVQV